MTSGLAGSGLASFFAEAGIAIDRSFGATASSRRPGSGPALMPPIANAAMPITATRPTSTSTAEINPRSSLNIVFPPALAVRSMRLGQLAAAQPPIQIQGVIDDRDRLARPEHVLDHDLLVLEHLVVFEEPAHHPQHVGRQLGLVAVIGIRRVAHADRHDLIVNPLLVTHPHHADGARVDDGQGEDRLLSQHQHVERIAVVAVGARDEAVVGGIVDGAVKHPIETQQPRFLVQLVLVRAPFRDLDDGRKGGGYLRLVNVGVVPRVHPPMVSADHLKRTRNPAEWRRWPWAARHSWVNVPWPNSVGNTTPILPP